MAFKKGNIPWNKNTKGIMIAWNKGKKFSPEAIERMKIAQKNRIRTDYKGKITKICEICKIEFSVFPYLKEKRRFCSLKCKSEWMRLSFSGENAFRWLGGLTNKNKLLRCSARWREWRKAVFERDNYTCVWCGTRKVELHPDHIKPFSLFPELRFVISNGRTLCRKCHLKTDTWGNKKIYHAHT